MLLVLVLLFELALHRLAMVAKTVLVILLRLLLFVQLAVAVTVTVTVMRELLGAVTLTHGGAEGRFRKDGLDEAPALELVARLVLAHARETASSDMARHGAPVAPVQLDARVQPLEFVGGPRDVLLALLQGELLPRGRLRLLRLLLLWCELQLRRLWRCRRQNSALDQPGGALHGGGFFMSLKVATREAGASAFRARRFHLSELYKAFTSPSLNRLRRTNKRRRASAMDRLINWFIGRASKHSQAPKAPQIANQSDVKLVLIGDGSRMNGIKGTKSSVSWAEMRRRFAQRGRNEGFMVLLNDEHCTSIKSACCGVRNKKAYKNKDKNYRLVRKDGRSYRPVQYSLLICPRCGRSLHRDGAAVTNQAHVTTYTLNGWGWPPWLIHGHN